MGQVQNEEHLSLIAVMAWRDQIKPPWSGDSRGETEWRLGRMVCERETARTNTESER